MTYRVVLQIEDVNEEGEVEQTYGPEPIIFLWTEDEQDAIDMMVVVARSLGKNIEQG